MSIVKNNVEKIDDEQDQSFKKDPNQIEITKLAIEPENKEEKSKSLKSKSKELSIERIVVPSPEEPKDYFTPISSNHPIGEILANKSYIDINVGPKGFAKIYKCKCSKTGQLYAIKAIRLDDKNVSAEQFFAKTIPTMATLKPMHNKYIVQIQEYFIQSNWAFIVMEFCNGSDLYEYLYKNGPLCETLANYWFAQVCRGLKFLHQELKIFHGDIRLENILFNNYIAKLADFMAAKRGWNDQTNQPLMTMAQSGKMAYFSPQKLQVLSTGEKYNPFAADIWAIGVILYLMINAEFPFGYPNPNHQLMINPIRINQLIKDYPNDLKELQLKIFHLNEIERIKIDQILAHNWTKRKKLNLYFKKTSIPRKDVG